jgi:diguanylate cyclase (GGDEF)-like protein
VLKRWYLRGKAATASWLCPTEDDRRRAVDTGPRVGRARNSVALVIGGCAFALAPVLGWWPAAIFAVQAAYLSTLDRRIARARYPELIAASGMLSTAIAALLCAAVTGGPESPLLPLVVLPVSFVAARFRERVVATGVLIGAIGVIAVGLAVDPAAMIANPAPTVVAVLVLFGVGAISVALQGAEVQHRTESVLDPLTGLLNRKAMTSRFKEMEEQARLTGGSVCLIEVDLDHFKRVNDSLGHSSGDAVLKDTAATMRKTLRSFELIYRIGGEEFLVLVPGADLDRGVEIAERLRRAVADARPGGVEITVSLGVAAAAGGQVQFTSLFAQADLALYEAKHAGRNRVCTSGLQTQPAELVSA